MHVGLVIGPHEAEDVLGVIIRQNVSRYTRPLFLWSPCVCQWVFVLSVDGF